uniref:UBC core domain-containing protein n=1 Tax=Bionectria ochroleuca TaxID=29856 RepID=A0A8H7TU53_BIOOC
MAPVNPQILTSFRKQRLQSEFAGLKQACPEGVFVSLTPTDPTIWSAILFVRDGPYAPAVLRFHISFPLSYPEMPPVVSFATDIFHPLITPLTTNMYTHDLQSTGAVSATDDERLPLGASAFGMGSRCGSVEAKRQRRKPQGNTQEVARYMRARRGFPSWARVKALSATRPSTTS